MRILVTGSRDWTDDAVVGAQLHDVVGLHGPGYPVTLVSGACPTGADAMAERYARACGWTVERHPAHWEVHGSAAGPIRNQEMVDLGADVCVAFILDDSKGATNCLRSAQQAGIRTVVHQRWSE